MLFYSVERVLLGRSSRAFCYVAAEIPDQDSVLILMGCDCGDGFFGGSDEVGEEWEGAGLSIPIRSGRCWTSRPCSWLCCFAIGRFDDAAVKIIIFALMLCCVRKAAGSSAYSCGILRMAFR